MSTFIICDQDSIANRVRNVLTSTGIECSASNVLEIDDAMRRLRREKVIERVLVVLPADSERGIALFPLIQGLGKCQILAIGDISDPRLILRSLRFGADEFIELPELESELASALSRLQGSTPGYEEGRLIAVLGPNGGCGSSTLAVNIAAGLAKQHKKVGLIDLKMESGDLAALLDLRPTFTIADLCRHNVKLDRGMFERSLVAHESGIHLLAPPMHFSDIAMVRPDAIAQALDISRTMFPYVVVDLDHSFREEQMVVLNEANIIVIVLRLEFASLRNAKRTIEHLERSGIMSDRIRLVVNRFGQAKEVPAAKAEEALGHKIFHYVPDEPKTVNKANNHGIPLVLDAPTSRVSRSLLELAMNVNGRHKA